MSLIWVGPVGISEVHEARVGEVIVGTVRTRVTGIFRSKRISYVAKSGFLHTYESCKGFNKTCNTLPEAKAFIEELFDDLVNKYKEPRYYGKA